MEIFDMRKFSECILPSQQKFRHKNSLYFLYKILLTIFGLLFFKADFHTKISYIFFIRNSLTISHKKMVPFFRTIFYVKDLHFLLKIFSSTFFLITLDREKRSIAPVHCCAWTFLPRSGRPFCQHNLIFW